MSKLLQSFYLQGSAVEVARQLLGKELCTNINGKLTSGIITETEAYISVDDKAHMHGTTDAHNELKSCIVRGCCLYLSLLWYSFAL